MCLCWELLQSIIQCLKSIVESDDQKDRSNEGRDADGISNKEGCENTLRDDKPSSIAEKTSVDDSSTSVTLPEMFEEDKITCGKKMISDTLRCVLDHPCIVGHFLYHTAPSVSNELKSTLTTEHLCGLLGTVELNSYPDVSPSLGKYFAKILKCLERNPDICIKNSCRLKSLVKSCGAVLDIDCKTELLNALLKCVSDNAGKKKALEKYLQLVDIANILYSGKSQEKMVIYKENVEGIFGLLCTPIHGNDTSLVSLCWNMACQDSEISNIIGNDVLEACLRSGCNSRLEIAEVVLESSEGARAWFEEWMTSCAFSDLEISRMLPAVETYIRCQLSQQGNNVQKDAELNYSKVFLIKICIVDHEIELYSFS